MVTKRNQSRSYLNHLVFSAVTTGCCTSYAGGKNLSLLGREVLEVQWYSIRHFCTKVDTGADFQRRRHLRNNLLQMLNNIQGYSGGKVNILEEIVSDIVRKTVHVDLCPILNCYRGRAV